MVPALSLWLPILLSAVAVFLASSVIHMFPAWHRSDFGTGRSLLLWFFYCLLIGLFAAYLAGRALGPGAHYLAVFRYVGATAFMCYTVGGWQASIWYKRTWSTTLKNTFDGLVYACVTAGVFGWLWPA